MIRQLHVENKTTNFDNTVTDSHGGFVLYWKLTATLFNQAKGTTSVFSTRQKISFWALFWIKTPWWCLIKPLYQMVSIQKNYKGTYVLIKHNGQLQEQTFRNATKRVTLKLVNVPVFRYTVALSNQDKSYLVQELN